MSTETAPAAAAAPSHELFYWSIRGLGSLVRAALTAQKIPFKDTHVDTTYFGEGNLHEKFSQELPIVNLPSLRLPTGELVTQTRAILNYVSRQEGPLKAKTDIELCRIDEVMETLWDCQTEKMKMSYGPTAKENIPSFYSESVPYFFGLLDKNVAVKKTEFLATSGYLTIADIFLTEMVDGLIKVQEGKRDFLDKFTNLARIYDAVKASEGLKEYYEKVKDAPHNNPRFACWF